MLNHMHRQDTPPATKGHLIEWAHSYDGVVRLLTFGQDRALRETTVNLAGIKAGDTILDVGCGTGDLTLAAKAKAGPTGSVTGIDAAPQMIEVAQRKAAQAGVNADFQVQVIEALPFADNTFDVALSSLMMHHLPPDVRQQGLREVYRVLKPGGSLLVIDVAFPITGIGQTLTRLMLHQAEQFGENELPAVMQTIGFTQIESGRSQFVMLAYVRGRKPQTS